MLRWKLLAVFYNVRWYCVHCWRKVTNTLTQLQTVGATIMTVLSRYGHCCNSSKNAMAVINHFLIGLKVYYTTWIT